MLLDPRYAWLRRLVASAVLLALWEMAGQAGMLNPIYAPMPSRIAAVLAGLFADGRISKPPSPPRSAASRSASPWASCSA